MAPLVYTRLRAEAVSVLSPPYQALRASGLSAFPLTLICTALIGVLALVQHTAAGWWVVERVAGVYQALPLPLILLRLPLSMLAPAPDLPAWGAMLQVLVVFGLGEAHLGRRRALIVAVCVNGLTTVSARIMVIVGLHLAIGTPQVDQYELDTGPSTVVVALSIYVAFKCRAYLMLTITAAAMAGEAVALPNLAGREHLVALGLGVAAYLVGERVPRRRSVARVAAPPRPAAEPMRADSATPAEPTASGPATIPATRPTADIPRHLAPNAVPRRPTPRP
ncbi:hypothetical protein KGA66_27500 [Actinocrinis puniceicyclus]|uniref:Uncharacterized protein n=1 Tax=Actinocrinis puniceicyclus TaxID=977794 RepID=A0A8J7WSK1_9ACTN|nr:hypothetical protein [Actinocrinis puniceicyclus]MBS2966813.1 hypothetical protein [Actinocrinis puniceicyclus]